MQSLNTQRNSSMDDNTIILCTEQELSAMYARGEIGPNGYVLGMSDLFEVMCDYYHVDPGWSPNDVY
jgi:hypothetical protein